MKNEKWSLEAKTGFHIFSLKVKWCFEYELEYGKVKNMECYRKTADNDKKYEKK